MKALKTDATIPSNIRVSRKERDVRPHFLEHAEGEGSPRRIRLDKPQLAIGRGEDDDIRVLSQRASREHAILCRQEEDYVIQDNGSRNGVFLNGVKIHSGVLRDGDVLQVADGVFVYHEG